jgi:hypothetical protein
MSRRLGDRWALAPIFVLNYLEVLWRRRESNLGHRSRQKTVIEMLTRNPECGAVIPGTGGVRKVRIALEGRGKSGGARVIYYFQNDRWPLIVLTIFAKNEKANLSLAERNALAKLIAELKTARAHKETAS